MNRSYGREAAAKFSMDNTVLQSNKSIAPTGIVFIGDEKYNQDIRKLKRGYANFCKKHNLQIGGVLK